MISKTIVTFCWLFAVVSAEVEKPTPTFEAFRPSGIRVSVPDVDGLTEFFFWANINFALEGKDLGTIRLKTYTPTNGKWIIEDMNVKLNAGDTIYYTFFVNIHNQMYRYERQKYTVEEIVERPETTPAPIATPVTTKSRRLSCFDNVLSIRIGTEGITVIRKDFEGNEQKEIMRSIGPISVTIEKGSIEFGTTDNDKKC